MANQCGSNVIRGVAEVDEGSGVGISRYYRCSLVSISLRGEE